MLDNGFPLATESNILKELIKPPNILRTVVNSVTGKTKYVSLIYVVHFHGWKLALKVTKSQLVNNNS